MTPVKYLNYLSNLVSAHANFNILILVRNHRTIFVIDLTLKIVRNEHSPGTWPEIRQLFYFSIYGHLRLINRYFFPQ